MTAGDRPLKIAIIHAADHGGGAEWSVMTLHLSLLAMGHESRLYVGSKTTDSAHVTEIKRVRTFPGLLRMTNWLERTFGWQYLYSPSFRNLVNTIDPDTDLVHVQSLWTKSGYADMGGLPRLTQRFSAIVTIREQWMMTGHCACPFDCQRWRIGCGRCPDLTLAPSIARDGTRFNWARKRRALRRSNFRVTTVSEWLRGAALKSPIFAGKHITTVHNSIDESVFTPGSKQQARAALRLPANAFVVMLTGQAVDGIAQGIAQHAVHAMNRIERGQLMALLVGRSSALVAQTLSLPKKVVPFQERPQDMAVCYRAADITACPSEYESFGRVAAESQACATPVVAFATGGLPEVVKNGVGGLVVPTGDTDALASAIQRLRDNPAERERMGRAGAAWSRTRFSRASIAQAFIAEYRKAIAKRAHLGNSSGV